MTAMYPPPYPPYFPPPAAPPQALAWPPAPPQPPKPPKPPKDHSALVQKLLLAAGATCVLVAASVFLAVSWRSIGALGQAAVVALATAVAAASTILLDRRRLPISAQALGAVTAGLLVFDPIGARRLDLVGLDSLNAPAFFAITELAVLLIVACLHRLTPRVTAYPMTVVGVAAALPLLGGLGLADAGRPLPGVAVTVAALVCAAASYATAVRSRDVAVTVVAVLASTGWAIGMLASGVGGVRTLPLQGQGGLDAAILLGVALVAAVLLEIRPIGNTVPAQFEMIALGALATVGPIVTGIVSGHGSATTLAVVSAALSAVAATGRRGTIGLVVMAAACDLVVGLRTVGLLDGDAIALELAAAAFALVIYAWRFPRGRAGSASVSAALAMTAAWTAGLSIDADRAATALVVALVATLSVAAWRARRPEELPLVLTTVVAGPIAFGTALFAQLVNGTPVLAIALLTYGAAFLAYAAATRRDWITVPASALLALAAVDFAFLSDIGTVEAYTLPLAGVAAISGWLIWRHNRTASSWAIGLPALLIAFLPSTMLALQDTGSTRIVLTLAATVVAVVVGLALRAAAPVVVGALSATAIAVSQSAPYAVGLPRWIGLGAAGIALLSIGIGFEQARTGARSAQRWFAELR